MKPMTWHELLQYKQSSQPVVSVYLATDPARNSKDEVRLTLKQMLERYDDGWVQKQGARMQEYLAREYDWQSKSLALFSAGKFWRVIRLPFPIANYAAVTARPYLRPLMDLTVVERMGIVVVDRERARYFVSQIGEIEEVMRVWRATPSRHKKGGENTAARIQRHADTHINQNLKHAATQAVEFLTTEACTRLMVGGHSEEAALFVSYLPKAWQAQVDGTFKIDMEATPAQVQTKVNSLIEAQNRERESALVEQVVDAAKKRTPSGALSLSGTLRALEAKRVMTLVVAEDFRARGYQCTYCGHLVADPIKACSVCGHKLVAVPHAIDLAIRQAMELDSTVITAHGEAAKKLKQLGGIGALFRY